MSRFDAFSLGEPVPTSLENAIGEAVHLLRRYAPHNGKWL